MPNRLQLRYPERMEISPLSILPCSAERRDEALALVLSELAPSQRREIAASVHNCDFDPLVPHGLLIAVRDGYLRGAAWLQPQPGKTAVLWPPQLVPGEDHRTAYQLAEAAAGELNRLDVSMAQVLLPANDITHIAVLTSIGFEHLADLVYLSCESERFATAPGDSKLEFIRYAESQRERFAQLVEQTYENTLDCAALNGVRSMDDVLDGYRAAGTFRAENWLTVRHVGQDVGVLLLADHTPVKHWELVYMGLTPAARGRGLGLEIVRHAQRLARRALVERIVLAVDEVNQPARSMYCRAGFEAWDRRAVYVRVCR
jgi:ribosomal protein S18 acetylase RimI-like enzyme